MSVMETFKFDKYYCIIIDDNTLIINTETGTTYYCDDDLDDVTRKAINSVDDYNFKYIVSSEKLELKITHNDYSHSVDLKIVDKKTPKINMMITIAQLKIDNDREKMEYKVQNAMLENKILELSNKLDNNERRSEEIEINMKQEQTNLLEIIKDLGTKNLKLQEQNKILTHKIEFENKYNTELKKENAKLKSKVVNGMDSEILDLININTELKKRCEIQFELINEKNNKIDGQIKIINEKDKQVLESKRNVIKYKSLYDIANTERLRLLYSNGIMQKNIMDYCHIINQLYKTCPELYYKFSYQRYQSLSRS